MTKFVHRTIAAAAIVGAAYVLTACGTSNAATDTAAPAAPASASASTPAPTPPTVTKVTVPSLAGLGPEVATSKLKALGLVASVTGDLSNPAFGVLSQDPAAGTQVAPSIVVAVTVGESPAQKTAREKAAADAEAARVAAEAAAAAAAADADLSTYQEIDDRTWALVAKDPESHVGEKYVIYGNVTQFDSATGKSTFRANTGGEQQEKSYNYDVNTIISAKDAGSVADVVTDDLLKMYVRVTGSLTYDTQIGGSTTVPQAVINSHELLGHDD